MGVNHEPISRASSVGDGGEPRNGVGSLLRASRLRCGEELDDVARVLRIRRRHLQSIEAGDYASLPGTTYAVGFIRAYADYLGLDSDEVVRRFKEGQKTEPGRPRKAELVFPSPMSETSIPRGALVFMGVVLALVVYGGWYMASVDNDFFKRWIEPVPARIAQMLPGDGGVAEQQEMNAATKPAPAAAPEAAAAEAASDIDAATSTTPKQPVVSSGSSAAAPVSDNDTTASSGVAPLSATAETSPEAPTVGAGATAPSAASDDRSDASSPAAASIASAGSEGSTTAAAGDAAAVSEAVPENSAVADAPAEAADIATDAAVDQTAATPAVEEAPVLPDARIVVTASSDSWVEIRELRTDAWVWGKLLRAGETYAVPDRQDLKMKTGNAGGLTISVDGASVPAIGASGEVVRNVILDPDRLKAGEAVFR